MLEEWAPKKSSAPTEAAPTQVRRRLRLRRRRLGMAAGGGFANGGGRRLEESWAFSLARGEFSCAVLLGESETEFGSGSRNSENIWTSELELESKSNWLLYFHATKPVQIRVGSNQLEIESVALLSRNEAPGSIFVFAEWKDTHQPAPTRIHGRERYIPILGAIKLKQRRGEEQLKLS
jgi:hypothetical protein